VVDVRRQVDWRDLGLRGGAPPHGQYLANEKSSVAYRTSCYRCLVSSKSNLSSETVTVTETSLSFLY